VQVTYLNSVMKRKVDSMAEYYVFEVVGVSADKTYSDQNWKFVRIRNHIWKNNSI